MANQTSDQQQAANPAKTDVHRGEESAKSGCSEEPNLGHEVNNGNTCSDTSQSQPRPGAAATIESSASSSPTYEQTHVHAVYDAIADHFSATRYSPWPLVARFLQAQPPGAVGLDVGCGNGKYLAEATGRDAAMATATRHFVLGSDYSAALAQLAYTQHARRHLGADVLRADALALPFRAACADFVICVAVVHHLSTRARRQAAVAELLRCVRPLRARADGPPARASEHLRQPPSSATTDADAATITTTAVPTAGRVLLYVWALEQASSRRGWTAGGAQDLLVPWVKATTATTTTTKRAKEKTKKNKGDGQQQQQDQPQEQGGGRDATNTDNDNKPAVFQRYYHLYREGELDEDVAAAGGRVVASGYERDNWWVIADPA